MSAQQRMKLFVFVVPTGHHEASWRLEGSPAERMYDLSYYADLARTADEAGLDALFFADAPALRTRVRHNTGGSVLEPFTLLSALAAVTDQIGLVGTASTTYSEPYNVARLLTSLDHLSAGRAGWNMVTTAYENAAANFSEQPHPPRTYRYRRADEFVTVAKKLWESWDSDAIVCKRTEGIYADTNLIHPIHHTGKHFNVAGPFQSARSPQMHPLLVQAGSSEPGRKFAAAHADVVFSVHRQPEAAASFRTELRREATARGRRDGVPLLLPGVSIYVASTHGEAQTKQAELDELVIPAHGISQIRAVTGIDLSGFGLDEILDAGEMRNLHGPTSTTRADEILALVEESPCTVRELVRRVAAARTHRVLVGTPEMVANSLEQWFASDACDGFNLLPPTLPAGLRDIIDHVLPILEARGSWWRAGGTLRERLGTPAVPIS